METSVGEKEGALGPLLPDEARPARQRPLRFAYLAESILLLHVFLNETVDTVSCLDEPRRRSGPPAASVGFAERCSPAACLRVIPMRRPLLSVVLVLLFAVDGVQSKQRLSDLFNKSVNPCDDIYRHVCVHSAAMGQVVLDKSYGLLYDIANKMKGRRNNSFNRIINAFSKELNRRERELDRCRFHGLHDQGLHGLERLDDFELGKVFGRMIAFGRFLPGSAGGADDVQVYCYAKENLPTCVVTLEGTDRTTVNSFSEIKNQFVKGIFQGYWKEFPELNITKTPGPVGFIYEDLNAKVFKEAILGPTPLEEMTKMLKQVEKAGPINAIFQYEMLLKDDLFAGYGNLLLAHMMYYSEKKASNAKLADELKILAQNVRSEIVDRVKKASWMDEDLRVYLLKKLEKIVIVMGIDEKYQNLTLLKERMKIYDEEFGKVPHGDDCELELLARAHGRALHRLLGGSVMSRLTASPHEYSMFEHEIIHTGHIVVS
uniref:Peptidase_M13_N domain-containing protein n=1 Tax=Steinernema glaseri TaxID=37863 RepID=A0A1I8AH74_9BILA